jgi:DNA-binding response OmpR family regulator
MSILASAEPFRPHALIVEDQPELRMMLTAALRHAGFDVTALPDGDAAVAETVRLQPDLVCLDIVLPNIGGLEVCESLRAHPLTARIPILMTSARGSALDRADAEQAGADDFAVKPLDPLTIGVRARALIERRAAAALRA